MAVKILSSALGEAFQLGAENSLHPEASAEFMLSSADLSSFFTTTNTLLSFSCPSPSYSPLSLTKPDSALFSAR